MANSPLLTLTLCFLALISNSCFAARESTRLPLQQQQQYGQCRLQNLNPLQPYRQIQHEAGVTEIWDQNNDQMQCAGVAATRHRIEPRGLLLPSFNNAPMVVYVIKGQGVLGTTFPGCPETYQSLQQLSEEGTQYSQRSSRKDQHQKLHRFRRGDVLALPAGVAHWVYNDGGDQLVVVVVHDTSNKDNQLDQNLRRFFLAGNSQERRQESLHGQDHSGDNVLQGFDPEILAEAFDVNIETARRLQSENDKRGFIVRVERGFEVVRPGRVEEEEEEREYGTNGLEETICSMRIKENIADPERADVYTARGGRISTVNSHNLPILRDIQLSAERGVLYRNAMVAPHWNQNAHSIMYIIRGSGRVQIVGNSNRPAFDGEVRQGQLLVIPQNFAVVKLAGDQGLEWISIKTNDLAKTSPLSGRTSVIRAIPEAVLANAYQISRAEARRLKYNREEVTIHSPRRGRSQQKASAWSIANEL
ncbi:11S globulin delta chain like [Actinidia chinensis var. chinensis]|uniref:11S globulin delta chain like n=1 Tax=Actinidia chinensis var. chinensis TaxID=1590841 RepID=A0A2R6PYJ3_ACTCC|nr:11S globulin delta chain like [Actinidia chinensis var. chinensis]